MTAQQVNIKSTEFQPQNEYLLIEPAKQESEKLTAAGIIIPLPTLQGPQGRQAYGTVISVGADVEGISAGSTVFFPCTDGLDFSFTDGEFMLIRFKSIIGTKK